MLTFHVALIIVSVAYMLWMLPVLVTFAPFIANCRWYFFSVPMHTGLRDGVSDFRLCIRTITLEPFSGFLYWRMNWHTEYHMFEAVPCYNLRKIHRLVAFDMPNPRTLGEAWREMRKIWRKRKEDPEYQFDTPLPRPAEEIEEAQDPSSSSLGDLAP